MAEQAQNKAATQGGGGDDTYYKVPLDLYNTGDILETNLYLYYQRQYILLKTKGTKWSKQDADRLQTFGAETFYVKFPSSETYHQFLDDKLKSVLENPSVETGKKAQALYEVADPVLAEIYSTPDSAEQIKSAGSYVKNCIKFLNEKKSVPELVQLSSKSLTEHTHALHVSAYSIALAKRIGIQSYDEIFGLGMGALLHDIGKAKIDEKILQKPDELDDREWQLVRQHPNMGYDILKNRQEVPQAAKRVVLEHHERVDGKGYPRGIKDLHVFSKIVSIADVFNAITSNTPYNQAKRPYEALKMMLETMTKEFDSKLMTEFIKMLSE